MWASETRFTRNAYGKILALVIFMLMVAPMMIFPAGSAIVWDSELEISTDKQSNYQWYPAVAVENGKVYAVWAHNDGKDYDIFFREHDGMSWQAELELNPSDMNINQWNPDIAVEGGVVHVVWHDARAVGGDYDIMYKKRDGGVWGAVEEISVDIGTEFQEFPSIAVSGGNVYVAWQDARDGDYDIFFRYHDGTNWSGIHIVNIDSVAEEQSYPRIAAGGGKVYIVWVEDEGGGDYDILMRTFDGSSWGSIMEVSEDSSNEEQNEPDIAFDAGIVHIVFQEYNVTDRDIFYRSWDGSFFSTLKEISTDSGTEFQNVPGITAEFGKVHVVWADAGGGDMDIVYRQFNGSSWLPIVEVSSDDVLGNEAQYDPEIATENGNIHVVWEDQGDSDNDIWYRKGYEPPPPDTFPPLITDVLIDGVSVKTIAVGTPTVTLTATVDDSTTGNSNIAGANYTIGQGIWGTSLPMFPDDALDSSVEGFNVPVDTSSLGVGTYEIWVYGWDEFLNENVIGAYATLIVVEPIHLEPGWNLASFPHLVTETSITTVLSSINGEYDSVWRFNSTDIADNWKHYHTVKPSYMDDLYDLNNTMGFWIYITEASGADLIIEDEEPTSQQHVPLYKGWNLVGYPSSTPRLRDTALSDLTFDVQITAIKYYDTVEDRLKSVEPGDSMEPGKGYWMFATQDCVWKVNS